MNNKILITGISGLIGSHIAKKINDYDIYGVDIDRNYLKFSKKNINNNLLLKYQEYRFKNLKNVKEIFYVDIRNQFEILKIIQTIRPSVILHLAALPLANLSFNLTQEAYSSIFNSTYNLLECIRMVNNKIKFIYTSSSMVYGNFLNNKIDESHITEPISAYGSAKLAGEILVKGFAQSFGIKSLIIRPSAVYGPSDINQRVVQNFVNKALVGEKISINDKDLVLDFTFVEDLVQGFIRSIEYCSIMKKKYDIFNITSADPRSLFELFEILKTHYPKLKYQLLPREKNVPTRGGLNTAKAEKTIGYKPKFTLEKGLAKYISIEKKIRNL